MIYHNSLLWIRFTGLKNILKIHLRLQLEAFWGDDVIIKVGGEDETQNTFETGKWICATSIWNMVVWSSLLVYVTIPLRYGGLGTGQISFKLSWLWLTVTRWFRRVKNLNLVCVMRMAYSSSVLMEHLLISKKTLRYLELTFSSKLKKLNEKYMRLGKISIFLQDRLKWSWISVPIFRELNEDAASWS